MPWPDVRCSLFGYNRSEPSSPTWCSLQWLKTFDLNDSHLAMEYKRAGDMIIDQREHSPDALHADGLFIPICYLYRHSLELLLKCVIRGGLRGGFYEDPELVGELLSGHNIGKLWERSRFAIEKRWPEGDKKIINNAQALIRDFHVLDRTGQNLRYVQTRDGKATASSYPDQICLRYLAESFDTIYHFLDAVSGAPWSEADVM